VGIATAPISRRWPIAQETQSRARAVGKKGDGLDPIIVHPDVKRMLLQMRAMTAAPARSATPRLSARRLHARQGSEGAGRSRRARRATDADRKAFSTDIGNEVSYLGVQVHGGMGFIEETGAAQALS